MTRRQTIASLGAGVSLMALPACTRQTISAPGALAATATQELDRIAYDLLRHEPERATSLGVDTGVHAALRGQIEDQTPAGQQAYADTLRADLGVARQWLQRADLSPQDRTSFEVVESAYANALDGFAQPYGDVAVGSWRNAPYVVIQNVGLYLDMPRFFESEHPVREPVDAEYYLARLEALPAALDGELTRIRSAREMGVVPPKFLLDRAIEQMEATIVDARDGGGTMAKTLGKKAAEAGLTGADFEGHARRTVEGKIVPALARQLAELLEQRTRSTDAPGMRERPGGEEWYRWALRASTTTTRTPDEIHRQGLEELAEIHGRMDTILSGIGYTSGTVGTRMKALAEDDRYKFADGDPGRAQIMDFIQDRLTWIRAQMPRAFSRVVDPNLEVRRLPLAEEPGAPTAYGGAGSKDGTIPGKMWINLRTTDLHRKYDLPTLVHHETIPGHVWEGEFSNTLPLIRSILAFNAFSEGWALYAEQLADELGAYEDDPAWALGYLQAQAFRAVRLVVDTGLHSKGWSRDRAIQFFIDENGNKREEVVNEVDRYCSWPGQACGYKVGHSEMVRLRSLAQQRMGAAYDLRTFNNAVVTGGNAPLDVLGKNVERYIAGGGG
jgi:uncharacterized protein (DUF885 family)